VITSTSVGFSITVAVHVIGYSGLSIMAPIALSRSFQSMYHGVYAAGSRKSHVAEIMSQKATETIVWGQVFETGVMVGKVWLTPLSIFSTASLLGAGVLCPEEFPLPTIGPGVEARYASGMAHLDRSCGRKAVGTGAENTHADGSLTGGVSQPILSHNGEWRAGKK
jgi:tetrahydromethanopterin S-methyltransferase subunit E